MSKTVLLWDIDGTLLLTGGAGKEAFNRLFEELFNEKYIWQSISPDGKTDPLIIEELFLQRFQRKPSPEEYDRVVSRYQDLMEEEIPRSPRFRVLPEAKNLLTKLSKQPHIIQGLATGNFERVAWQKLRQASLDSFFHFGGYGSDAPDRKSMTRKAFERARHHLQTEPREVYVIGDTIHDIRAGKFIGAKTIAVCTGSTPREELEPENPDHILTDLSEWKLFL